MNFNFKHTRTSLLWILVFSGALFAEPEITPNLKSGKEDTKMESTLSDGLYVEFQTTMGNIMISLEFEKTPMTAINFAGLAEGSKETNKPEGTPFYDGIIFHRVIDDFMLQGGDPTGTGMGGPGYKFPDEFVSDLKHSEPGILSMANSGPGTNGSQFFITLVPTPHLDGKHTVFGRVIDGMDVVNAIAKVEKGASDKPVTDIVITKALVHRIGDKAEAFKTDEASFQDEIKNLDKKAAEQKDQVEKDAVTDTENYLKELEKNHEGKVQSKPSGLKYVVLEEGEGDTPDTGTNIKVHYEGALTNGDVFDSSYKRGEPIEFPVGNGRVIAGWDESLIDMKKGEKRILVIPYDLAYGKEGHGPIPAFATLIFTVELVDF